MKLTVKQRVLLILANTTYGIGLKRPAHYFGEKYNHAVTNDPRFIEFCNDFFKTSDER